MSDTVAEAAETASVALIAEPCVVAFEVSRAPPLGNKTRTTPSQNATLTKNIMVLSSTSSPLPRSPEITPVSIPRGTVAGTFENRVRLTPTFLRFIDANAIRFF